MQINSYFQQSDSHQTKEMNNISLTAIPNQHQYAQNPKLIEFPKKQKRIKKSNQKRSSVRLLPRISLSKKRQLQYFYIALQYSLDYPYYNLSWNYWKNDSYYNEISSNLSKLKLAGGPRTSNQCKSKDQVLKKKYFLKENSIDLLEISEKELRKEVYRLAWLQSFEIIHENTYNDRKRYENVLKRIDQSRELLKCKKKYEVQYEKLLQFGSNTNQIIQELVKQFIQ